MAAILRLSRRAAASARMRVSRAVSAARRRCSSSGSSSRPCALSASSGSTLLRSLVHGLLAMISCSTACENRPPIDPSTRLMPVALHTSAKRFAIHLFIIGRVTSSSRLSIRSGKSRRPDIPDVLFGRLASGQAEPEGAIVAVEVVTDCRHPDVLCIGDPPLMLCGADRIVIDLVIGARD